MHLNSSPVVLQPYSTQCGIHDNVYIVEMKCYAVGARCPRLPRLPRLIKNPGEEHFPLGLGGARLFKLILYELILTSDMCTQI